LKICFHTDFFDYFFDSFICFSSHFPMVSDLCHCWKSISTVNTRRIHGKRECFSRFSLKTQRDIHGFRFGAFDFLKMHPSNVGHLSSSTTRATRAVFLARVSTVLLTEHLDFLNFGRYVNTNREQS